MMKNFFNLLVISTFILTFISCEKGSIKNVDTISYGTSFGMCAGYCVNNLSIRDETVTFSKSKNGHSPETKTCKSMLSASEVKELRDLLNESEIFSLPKTIGCPDCADGGAEWVAVTTGSKEYKVVFEYGHAPTELASVVAKLRGLKETFKNCN